MDYRETRRNYKQAIIRRKRIMRAKKIGIILLGAVMLFFAWRGIRMLLGKSEGQYAEANSNVRHVSILEEELALENVKVFLDAGHGGKDPGTIEGDVFEKDIVLDMTLRVKELLESKGVEVVLSREDDSFVSLEDRPRAANDSDAQLFVSFHCNYFEGDGIVRGLECYYQEGSKKGKRAAQAMLESLEAEKIAVRGVRQEDFCVLRNAEMTAVLIELGFLSDERDCDKLMDETYREKLSIALANSILGQVKES